MPSDHAKADRIRRQVEAIEAEMKREGAWRDEPPPPEARQDMGPFGMKTLSFDQWLQFVFFPRVRELLDKGGPWPSQSAVGVQAIREFDRLFEEPEPNRGPEKKTHEQAERHYRRGDALWQEGKGDLALAELLRAVEIDPSFLNAQNYAGWILTKFFPGDAEAMARGIRLLEGARALAPEDTKPLYNLGDAYHAAGEADRALAMVGAALEQAPDWAEAHNYAGWLYAIATERDPERGVAHLEEALRLKPGYADARFNLGRAFAKQGDHRRALGELHQALEAGNLWDMTAGLAALAACYETVGSSRRALRAYRQAKSRFPCRSMVSLETITQGARGCEEVLRRAGAYFPHEEDEATMLRAEPGRRRSLQTFRGFLSAARRAVAERAQTTDTTSLANLERLNRMIACIERQELLPEQAGQPFGLRGDPRLRSLQDAWWELMAALYERVLEEKEPEAGAARPSQAAIQLLIAQERHDEALSAVEAFPMDGTLQELLFGAWLAEREGDRAIREGRREHSRRYYGAALRRYRQHAAEAGSGAEGLGRMVDVARLQRKRGEV